MPDDGGSVVGGWAMTDALVAVAIGIDVGAVPVGAGELVPVGAIVTLGGTRVVVDGATKVGAVDVALIVAVGVSVCASAIFPIKPD